MIAIKGIRADMTAGFGKAGYAFEIGRTEREDRSKTGNRGFHCCEYAFDCLSWYSPWKDRFFLVEAAGSIDEDDMGRIACTELTPIKELTPLEYAGYGMRYMVLHPSREGWKHNHNGVTVSDGPAVALGEKYIAISRGAFPKARGPKGSILGLVLEPEPGVITAARVFTVTDALAGKQLTIDAERKLYETQGNRKVAAVTA